MFWDAPLKFVSNAVEDTVDWAAKAVEDAARATAQALEDVARATAQAIEDTARATAQAIEDTARATRHAAEEATRIAALQAKNAAEFMEEAATGAVDLARDSGDWGLSAVDTYVFDPVEYVTDGVVTVDYSSSGLAAAVGVPDVLYAGASIGENGAMIRAENLVSGVGAHVDTDSGFGANASAGIGWGPIPYVEGHVERGADGSVSVGGELQGVLPLPGMLIDGDLKLGVDVGADGSWSVISENEATAYTPSGAYSGEIDVAVGTDAQGNTDVGVGVGAGYDDYQGTKVDARVQYVHDEDGATTTDGVQVKATAAADDVNVDAGLGVKHVDGPEGAVTTVGVNAHVESSEVTVDAAAGYRHEEGADGSVRNTAEIGVAVKSDEFEAGLDAKYDNHERSDGSKTETFGIHANAAGAGISGNVGADYEFDRDIAGNETEDFRVGANVSTEDFDASGLLEHQSRTGADGSSYERTAGGGMVSAGQYGASGGFEDVTSTNPLGVETGGFSSSGQTHGIGIPGTNLANPLDIFTKPPELGDLIPKAPDLGALFTPPDLGDMIPAPPDDITDLIGTTPTLDDFIKVPTLPDASALIPAAPAFPDLGLPSGSGGYAGVSGSGPADPFSSAADPFGATTPMTSTVPSGQPTAQELGQLAASGDLSSMFDQTGVAGAATGSGLSIQSVAEAIADGDFDDFTGSIIGAEVNEAAADDLWDELDL